MTEPAVKFDRAASPLPYYEEGDIVTVNLVLSEASTETVTVHLDLPWENINPGDVTLIDDEIVFAPGETTATVRIQVNDDTTFESDEMMKVEIIAATNATVDTSETGGVGDNNEFIFYVSENDFPSGPTVAFDRPASGLTYYQEGDVVRVDVVLSEASTETVTVNLELPWENINPGDLTLLDPTITFEPGETTATVRIRVNDDTTFESDEMMQVEIVSATNATVDISETGGLGTKNEFYFYIEENDFPSDLTVAFERSASDVLYYDEGDIVRVNVVLSEASTETVTVNLEVPWDSINPGDITLLDTSVVFEPGETTATVRVKVNEDALTEFDEMMKIEIVSATNAVVDVSESAGTGTSNEFFFYISENEAVTNTSATGDVLVQGTLTVGKTLTADASDIQDDDGLGSFGYQWYRDGQAISGATGQTYTLTADDAGSEMTVAVSFTDQLGFDESITSTSYGTVGVLVPGAYSSGFTIGTDGNDELHSGAGLLDIWSGGLGEDVFVFGSETSNGVREFDIITDFDDTVDEVILPDGTSVVGAAMTQFGAVFVLSGDGDVVVLLDEGFADTFADTWLDVA